MMSVENTSASPSPGRAAHGKAADMAYRRAWLSLALYPLSLVAAFAVAGGLSSAMGGVAGFQVLVAAVPAMLVFAIPGVLAVTQGRAAMRLGRRAAKVPVVIGAAIAVGFVVLNLTSFLLTIR